MLPIHSTHTLNKISLVNGLLLFVRGATQLKVSDLAICSPQLADLLPSWVQHMDIFFLKVLQALSGLIFSLVFLHFVVDTIVF